ncbi:hypothetical protein [Clostridium sp. C8-1-8]|uniref:hypothetical protein n=1 Tax=Clostridium sp. C8-1-8 TaxID=2698831 RepID=UPI00136807DA|nr:hypothetical protein [Clostridium sp. C8-1-8]
MNLLYELKISMFKPHLYHKFKDQPFGKLLKFDFLVAITGFIFFMFMKAIKGVIYGNFSSVINYYITFDVATILGIILYSAIGTAITALFLSFLFLGYNKFKHINNMSFSSIYNYATHTLLIAIFIGNLMGPFVILFILGYYIMAVKGDLLNAQDGVSPLKYLRN